MIRSKMANVLVEIGTAQKSTSLPIDGKKVKSILATINGLNNVARDSLTFERMDKVSRVNTNEDGSKAESTSYIPVQEEISRYKIIPPLKVFIEPRCVYGTVYSYGMANMKKAVKFSDSEKAGFLSPVDFQLAQEELCAAFRKYNVNFESLEALNHEDSLANVLTNVRDENRAKVDNMDAISRYPIELINGVFEAGYLDRDLSEVEKQIGHQVIRAITSL